ncbi:MAG: PAS domain-containing protein [Chloroflexaceae bacterium]|nr:PAS domain-containing protein [Chloroflexaceae bacterium]
MAPVNELEALRQRLAELEAENRRLHTIITATPEQIRARLHLFETMPWYVQAAIVVVEAAPLDPPGPRVIYANPSFEKLSGTPVERAIGQPLAPLVEPDIASVVLLHLRQVGANQTPQRTSFTTRAGTGDLRAFELEAVPVPDMQGPAPRIIVYLRDISAQWRTQREHEALLTRLAETNRRLLAELEARRRAERKLERLNQQLEHQVEARTAQLRVTIAELQAEVRERRRVSLELQQHQAFLQTFLDHVPAVIAVQDLEGRFILVNRKLLNFLGLTTPEQILGQTADPFYPPEVVRMARQERLHIQRTGEHVTSEYGSLDLSGNVWLMHSFPIRGADGAIIATGRIAMDITERKRHEEERLAFERQLQEAQRRESIGILASGLAHDFNNLLAAINGHAELALLDLPPGSPPRESVEAIVQGVQRATDLTAQMLAYAGKGRFLTQPVQLNELVHEMADLLRPTLSRHTTVHQRLAANLPLIEADASQIRQVILNLLVNANEALNDQPGQITLETAVEDLDQARLEPLIGGAGLPPGQYVRLSVSDTGCGMDEATRSRMFEPFFSTKFTGRGLGLAALHGIVRSHRGAIEVLSAPDQGTTVHIYLPAAISAPRAPDPSPVELSSVPS